MSTRLVDTTNPACPSKRGHDTPASSLQSPVSSLWRGLAGLAILIPLAGCSGIGISANPFRVGNLPAGDIVRTHAKPPLRGFYHNFDPKAHTLTIAPAQSINQVRTQHVLVATVCDKKGNGLRNRRVEWHATGAGHIVEVDESGFLPGRGYMVDDQYAVSYTNYRSHTITRGNEDPKDDIHLKPGQSWCVISSPIEGETHVTCYAPGIADWENHKVFVVKQWIDAKPIFPQSSVNATGQPHTLTTCIVRTSDGSPVAGYIVRYRILGGPPAVLDPGAAQVVDALTNAQGSATAVLRQVQPVIGINRIGIEVIRPAAKPTGKSIMAASTQITKTWVAPNLTIQKSAPSSAVVGQQIPYLITVTNTGTIASRGGTIRDTLPEGLQFVSATPPATRLETGDWRLEDGDRRQESEPGHDTYSPASSLQPQASSLQTLLWDFGPIQPSQSVSVQFVCMATAAGTVTNCAEAAFLEGITGRSCAVTQVLSATLQVSKTGPTTAVVGQPLTFQLTVINRGNAPALDVTVTDTFDSGFVHETGSVPVLLSIGNLDPGQSRSMPITLTPRAPGRQCNRVTATAAGGLSASAEHCVQIVQPQLVINKSGPKFAFVGSPVEYQISVRNTGSIPANDVIVRDRLPSELKPLEAPNGGLIQENTVSWSLGTLAPGQERVFRLTAQALEIGKNVCNVATVSAAEGVNQQSSPACLDVRGVPALLTELIDRFDAVPVGAETTYTIQITNQGSVPADAVSLVCQIPAGMEYVGAEGAVPHEVTGRTVTFEPFEGMAPQKRLLYQVQVRALRPGDHRFEARVMAKQLKSPVVMQESTTVYDPNTGSTNDKDE